MKYIKRFIFIIIGIYVFSLGVLYLNQEKLLFHPDPLPIDFVFRDGYEEKVLVEKDVNISCLVLEKPDPEGVIFYLHGNRGSIRRCLKQAYQVDKSNYTLVMPDYRGYGKSDGSMESEAQMNSDIQKVYDHFIKKIQPQKIIVAGYSMGSGMASYLAQTNQVDQLYLIAPFTSLTDIKDMKRVPVPDLLMKYDFDTEERINEIKCPITIFHAPNDDVIPYECSKIMTDRYPKKIKLITLGNVGHRGAIFSKEISREIESKT